MSEVRGHLTFIVIQCVCFDMYVLHVVNTRDIKKLFLLRVCSHQRDKRFVLRTQNLNFSW